jgi:hypothetical protein
MKNILELLKLKLILLDSNFQKVKNLIINDNKDISKIIAYKFCMFLKLNKLTSVSSKKELIELLDKKTESSITGIQILVSELKNFDKNLACKLVARKIWSQIKTSKINQTKQIIQRKTNLLLISNDNQNNLTNELNNSSKVTKLLKSKLQTVKNSLENNQLPFPINLFNPLLSNRNKSLALFNNNNGKLVNSNTSSQNNTFKENGILGLKSDSNLYVSAISEYKKMIDKYNLNNLTNLTNTSYLQFINGHKIINEFQQNIRYYFSKYSNIKIDNIITLLECSFRAMSCLISKPVFLDSPNELVINLFYFFIPGRINRVKKFNRLKRLGLLDPNKSTKPKVQTNTYAIFINNRNKKKLAIQKAKELREKFASRVLFSPKNLERLNILCTVLSRIFNKKIVLDLIPLKSPLFDDSILVKTIGIICNKVSVRTIFNFIFRKAILYSKVRANLKYKFSLTRSYLSGIKIKIGGRLMTQKVIPRISTREMQRGPISHRKVSFVD